MFYTSWSYFKEFLTSFKLLFTVLKNSNNFLRYDKSNFDLQQVIYGKGKLKRQK